MNNLTSLISTQLTVSLCRVSREGRRRQGETKANKARLPSFFLFFLLRLYASCRQQWNLVPSYRLSSYTALDPSPSQKTNNRKGSKRGQDERERERESAVLQVEGRFFFLRLPSLLLLLLWERETWLRALELSSWSHDRSLARSLVSRRRTTVHKTHNSGTKHSRKRDSLSTCHWHLHYCSQFLYWLSRRAASPHLLKNTPKYLQFHHCFVL